jgi:hypothetical protein
MSHVMGRPPSLVPMLAALAGAVLAGCTGGATPSVAHHLAPSPARPAGSGRPATAKIGSPGNPLNLACAQESFTDPAVPQRPGPGDLTIGPLFIVGGKRVATASPAGYGDRGSYKIPLILVMGSTATVTIAAPARGHVVISNPYSPVGGVAAAKYHSCARRMGFFAQGFAFTHGQIRGCVPLDVRIGHEPRVRHVTISLFAGSCPRRP